MAVLLAQGAGCATGLRFEAALARGQVALEDGDPLAARGAFALAISIRPGDPRGHHGLARAWLDGGEPEIARELMLELRENQPVYFYANMVADYVDALDALTRRHLLHGEPGEALPLLGELAQLAPDHPGLLALRVETRVALGERARAVSRLEDAERHFRAALELAPASVEAALGLARTHVAAGDPQSALPVLASALEKHPENRDLLELMVEVLGMR